MTLDTRQDPVTGLAMRHRKAPFIKQFSGPSETSGVLCFPFFMATVASGCPGSCSYCFLMDLTPYRSGLYALDGTIFDNIRDLDNELHLWLTRTPTRSGMIVGENQDGLAFERPYKRALGISPLEIMVPRFAGPDNQAGHTLIVLSKFVSTELAEASVPEPTPHVVFSWSLSLPSISAQYERKVAPLERRLEKAREMKEKGWRIRFRLDALAPIPEWSAEIDQIVGKINEIGPEMLTLGALRATNTARLRTAAENQGRDASIFDHLRDRDPSGFKYRVDPTFHAAAFRQVMERLSPEIPLGLCKEDQSLWKDLGLPWKGCHCLATAEDEVTTTRLPILHQIGNQPPRTVLTGLINQQ